MAGIRSESKNLINNLMSLVNIVILGSVYLSRLYLYARGFRAHWVSAYANYGYQVIILVPFLARQTRYDLQLTFLG